MAERFFVDGALELGPATLEGPEAHHLLQVCRLRPGATVMLFNGDGHEYRAELLAGHRSRAELLITQQIAVSREAARSVSVAAPLPKGDRAAFLIEKLTELGVTRFIPLRTERSVVHPGEGKVEKLRRYVIEAGKQCGRNVLMRIEPARDWSMLLQATDLPTERYVADLSGAQMAGSSSAPTTVAIGPEGGFTVQELGQAEHAGWQRWRLANAILRVETAAIAAATRLVSY